MRRNLSKAAMLVAVCLILLALFSSAIAWQRIVRALPCVWQVVIAGIAGVIGLLCFWIAVLLDPEYWER